MDLSPVPGFAPSTATMRRRGLSAVILCVVALVAVWGAKTLWPDDKFAFTLRTSEVAAGITEGSRVTIHGIQVGSVARIAALGNGQQGVTVELNPADGRTLTNYVEAAFSAGNLFGVSEIVLTPHDGGGPLRRGAQLTPTKPITDNTVANMIATIGDVNSDAVRPNAGQVLINFDASSKAMLPLVTALGGVAQAIHDTQKLSATRTFPTLVQTLQTTEVAIDGLLPGARALYAVPALHTPDAQRMKDTLDYGTNAKQGGLTGAIEEILNPRAQQGLRTVTPMLVNLIRPILSAFPDNSASGIGIQLSRLLDNVRAAMPDTPTGPTLNLRVQAYFPAIASALPR